MLLVQAEVLEEEAETDAVAELAREYRAVLENILLIRGARGMAERLRQVTGAGQIADLSGYSPDLSLAQKVEVLEAVELEPRLHKVLGWARETLADLTLRRQIQTDVEEGMERTQREFLLRRQLDAIRKELGRDRGHGRGRRGDAGGLPRTARRARPAGVGATTPSSDEIDKLERTSEQSPEHGWIRTWIDTVLELPWGVRSADDLDIEAAAACPR